MELLVKKENWITWFIIIFFTLLFIPFPLISYYRFIVLSLCLAFFWSYSLYNQEPIKLTLFEIALGGGTIFSFLSGFWALDAGLIWFPSFIWLSIFLWVVSTRILLQNKSVLHFIHKLFVFIFFIAILQYLYALSSGISPHYRDWNFFFGYNSNYTSCVLALLYPFVFYFRTHNFWIGLIKYSLFFLILFFSFYVESRGIFLIILLYPFLDFFLNRGWGKKVIYIFLMIVLFLLICFICEYSFFQGFSFTDINDEGRIEMIRNSLDLFSESPITGKGIGNWHLEAYKYPSDLMFDVSSEARIFKVFNHNLYSLFLSELGILGILIFLTPLAFCFKKIVDNFNTFSPFYKAISMATIAYLIMITYYRDANNYEFLFCGIQYLSFGFIGVILEKYSLVQHFHSEKLTKKILLFLSILCLGWFSYSLIVYHKCFSAVKNYEENRDIAIHDLTSAYHPIFKTVYGNDKKPIAFTLGNFHYWEGNKKEARKYYEQAIKQAPYNDEILLQFAIFLYREGDVEKAIEHTNTVHVMNKYYWQPNYYLALFALKKGETQRAKTFLENISDNSLKKPAILRKVNDLKRQIELRNAN